MSDIDVQISALRFKRGDVLLVRGKPEDTSEVCLQLSQMKPVRPLTDEVGAFKVPIIRVDPGVSIEVLDEDTMVRAGWVRWKK